MRYFYMILIFSFIATWGFSQTQMDLPVTFDDAMVNYSVLDFSGNTSSFVTDPTNPANMVVQTDKSNTAQFWAGTTLAVLGTPPGSPNDVGFASAIPISVGNTQMTVRVYSPDAGIPVRLKIEDATDATHTVETEAMTTVVNTWETLTFNFSNEAPGTAAVDYTYTYDKVSIFFNFGTDGATAGAKTYYWDDVEFIGGGGLAQMDLPLTFDDAMVNYSVLDFSGNTSSFVTDPTNPANMVVQTDKSNTAQFWAGTTLAVLGTPPGSPNDIGLASVIPVSLGNTQMTVRVYSPDAGIPVRLKIEDATDATHAVETEAMTTVANTWETLTFDFSNEAMGSAIIDYTYTYDKVSIFFNFGTDGATAGAKTYYWDDVEFTGGGLAQMDLPVTFNDATVNYSVLDFSGNTSSFVADPTNPGNMVVRSDKSNTALFSAGTTLAVPGTPPGSPNDVGFASVIPISVGNTQMTVRVYSPDAGIPVRLKLEEATDATHTVETEAMTTVANTWETLTFDFSNEATGTAVIDFTYAYDKASIFFNFGTDGATAGAKTYYWDDVAFVGGGLVPMDLPVTFDDVTVNYSVLDFSGNTSSFVNDPTNVSNRVVRSDKSNTALFSAGTTLAVPGSPNDVGFASVIPISVGHTEMTVRVYSPDAGVPIRLKLEESGDATHTVETEEMITMANTWETLTFDFSNEATGTTPIDYSYSYDKASIFFNFGTDGATAGAKTYYWDDVEFLVPPPLTQMGLPVTFDDTTVNYATVDFGGNTSVFANDPTDPTNKVTCSIKTAGAQTWAGTTLDAGVPNNGFANPIPFTATSTKLIVDVYSPVAGIPVMLKVEDKSVAPNTVFIEAQATTTAVNTWESLIFDFNTPTNTGGGATLTGTTLDLVSIFFDFGQAGMQDTFYWDNLEFVAAPSLAQMDLPVTFDDTATVNYGAVDFGGALTMLDVVDPTGGTNLVAQTEKTAGAQFWAGTTLATPGTPNEIGFANAVPFATGATTMTLRVYSPTAGIPVRLKLEDYTDNTITVEVDAMTTVANAWETLTYDFTMEASGTAALDMNNTYDKASVFFNFDPTNGGGTGEIYYWDDLEFVAAPSLAQMDLPVTFDDTATVNYGAVDFGGALTMLDVVDPAGGTNLVAQTEKTAGAQFWAGTTLATPGTPNEIGFANAVPFATGATTMTLRVYSPTAGIPVRLKLEDYTDNTITVEVDAMTTVANAWETLTYDFTMEASGTAALDMNNTYDKASVFFNFDPTNGGGTGEIYYWDDLEFVAAPSLAQMDLPVTFDDTATVNYGAVDFGGALTMLDVVDPTGGTNLVAQTEKTAGAQFWAGTTLATPGTPNEIGFANAVPFATGATTMTLRVYSPTAGIPVRLKLEDYTDNTITVEVDAMTTVANAWETLTYDFTMEASGTAALDMNNTYDKASVFFNFDPTNGGGTGEIYYWDDLEFVAAPPLTQMGLPVTFDDTTVNYATIDFGGNTSVFANDPIDPTNKVTCSIKTAGAQTWAGTTLDAGAPNNGFANPIPFTATETTMTVDVYSPSVGITVMLKVEDKSVAPNTVFIEAQATTTVANTWETLAFDFSAPTNTGGGATLTGTTLDLASIFFDFGQAGMQDTFYWDNLEFGGVVVDPCDGVTADALILDDFECQGNINYTFANATWTEDVANPDMSGVNTSAMAGQFIHWGAGTDGAFGGSLDLGPIDISTANLLKVDVWTNANALPITIVLQDGNAVPGDIVSQSATTSATGMWETLEFDMSAAAGNTDVSNIVFVVNPGTNDQDTLYIDNVRFEGIAGNPCAGVMPDQNVFDDFECQGNINYTFANATWTEDVANPDMSGVNTSAMVGEFIHWGAGTDGAFGGELIQAPIDLTTDNQLKVDVWTNTSGLPITIVLQDASGNDLTAQANSTSATGMWETLTFNMSAATDETGVSNIVIVVNPGSNIQDTIYFDNIRLEGFVADPCANTTPDQNIMEDFDCQRNLDYQFAEGGFITIANPDASGVNTSANVGEYTRNNTIADAFGGDFTLAPLDFATNNQIKMNVWDANVPSEVTIVLQDASGADVGRAVAFTSTANAWEDLNFDFSETPDAAGVSKIVLLFDAGSEADSNNVYYFDNLRMEGFVGIKDINVSSLEVYPNPTNDIVNINLDKLDNTLENGKVSIYAIDGRLVKEQDIIEIDNSMLTLDISNVVAGLYFIEITDDSANKWVAKISKR